MANYATLTAAIQDVIKTNGNNEITGALMQQTLLAILNSLGSGFQFMGVATTETAPGTPDQNVVYIADPGTYPNFSNAVVADGYMGVFKYNGTWTIETIQVGKDYDVQINKISHDLIPLLEGGVKVQSVNIPGLSVRNYSITTSGTFGTSNTYKHSIVDVSPGSVVKVTASATNMTRFAFVKSKAAGTSGGDIDLCAGCSCVQLDAGTEQYFVAPADAVAFLIYRGSGSAYANSPSSVIITKSAFNKEQVLNGSVTTDYANVGTVVDAAFNGTDYNKQSIDLSSVPEDTLSISASNTFNSTGNHGLIYVDPGDVLEVVGGGGLVAFVGGIYCPHSGSSVSDLALTTTMRLESGKTYYLRVPSGAKGFIYNTVESGNNVAPVSLSKYTNVLQENTLTAIPAGRWIFSSGVIDYGANSTNKNFLFRLYGGRRYAIKVTDSNAAFSGVILQNVPYIGESYSSLISVQSPNLIGKDLTFFHAPAQDCYLLFRLYKSSSPTYNVTAYDITEITGSVQDEKDINNTMFFWRLNYHAFTMRSRVILTEGLYGTATNYKHILVPVKAGQYIKVAKGTNNARLAWFTEKDTPSDNGVPPYLPGTSCFTTTGGILRVPDGANYLYIQLGQSPYDYWPSYIGYSVDYTEVPDIVRTNDLIKTRRLLFQIKSQTRDEMNGDGPEPLVLLHYSDIHGRTTCQNRINDYREFWAEYIDDTIQTGDLVTSYWGNGSAFGDESDPATNPSKDILSVIGNHDTASYSNGEYNWHAYQGKQAYDRYIGPYVANWNVVQPAGAAENGYCFYYKDYPNSGIRLVVIDAFDNDETYQATQQSWLESVLADAITNELSVIMASHFRIRCESLLKCPFTRPGVATENPDTSICNVPYVAIVGDFINNGGELICWITGHSHYDAVSKTSEQQGSQINICVAQAGRVGSDATELWKSNSFIAVDFDDWKTFDLFNVMAIDTKYKYITLFRVGSSWDKIGRKIETCAIKYTTGEIQYP